MSLKNCTSKKHPARRSEYSRYPIIPAQNSSKIRLWFEDWHVHKDKYLASPFHFHAQLHFFVLRQIRCGARRSLSVDMSWWFTALDLDRATSVFEPSDGETTKMLHQNEWLEPENYRHLIQPPHKFPDSKSSKRDMYVNPLVISHRITFKKNRPWSVQTPLETNPIHHCHPTNLQVPESFSPLPSRKLTYPKVPKCLDRGYVSSLEGSLQKILQLEELRLAWNPKMKVWFKWLSFSSRLWAQNSISQSINVSVFDSFDQSFGQWFSI